MPYEYDPSKAPNAIYGAYGSGTMPIIAANGGVESYRYNPQTRNYLEASSKAPVQNAQGIWVDPVTKAPYHGTYKDPMSGVEQHYSNGKSVLTAADVNAPATPVFNSTTTTKQPQINAAADTALATSTANSANTAKSFADYLAQAKAINDQGAVQLTKDQAAVDPSATIARVNAATAKTTTDLNAANRTYATQQQGVQDKVAQQNTDYAKQVQDRLDALSAEQANYEQKSQTVADQAFNAARAGISLYQMGTGTPTSGSGNLTNRYIRSYEAINAPLQRELSQNRSGLINLGRQTDQQLYQNKLAELSGQAALNTDLTNRSTDTTKYTGNLDTTTAQYIQSLMQSTAGMSRQMAAQYLQQLAVPFDVGQHILSGDIQNLAGIQNLYNGANWYTQSKPYESQNVPATPYYGVRAPVSNGPAARSYAPEVAPASGGGNYDQNGNYNPYLTNPRDYSWQNNAPTPDASKMLSGKSPQQLAAMGLLMIGPGRFQDEAGNTYDASGNLVSNNN